MGQVQGVLVCEVLRHRRKEPRGVVTGVRSTDNMISCWISAISAGISCQHPQRTVTKSL